MVRRLHFFIVAVLTILNCSLPAANARRRSTGNGNVHYVKPLSSSSWSRTRHQRPWQSPESYSSSPRNFGPQSYRSFSGHILKWDSIRKDSRVREYRQIFMAGRHRRARGKRTLTSKIIGLTVAAFVLQSFRPGFTDWGVKRSDVIRNAIDNGEIAPLYRLVTPIFLHGGLGHLFTNMLSLNRIGPEMEHFFGTSRFVLTYLASGVVGSLVSAYQSPNPSLGASGAVFGMMGAFSTFLGRHDWLLGRMGDAMYTSIMQTAIFNLAIGAFTPYIDNWAHAGGFFGGMAVAYYLGPRLYWVLDRPGSLPTMVDRPIVRLPRIIENFPQRVTSGWENLEQKYRRWRISKGLSQSSWLPQGRPWQRGDWREEQEQRLRRRMTPNRSIKPNVYD